MLRDLTKCGISLLGGAPETNECCASDHWSKQRLSLGRGCLKCGDLDQNDSNLTVKCPNCEVMGRKWPVPFPNANSMWCQKLNQHMNHMICWMANDGECVEIVREFQDASNF